MSRELPSLLGNGQAAELSAMTSTYSWASEQLSITDKIADSIILQAMTNEEVNNDTSALSAARLRTGYGASG